MKTVEAGRSPRFYFSKKELRFQARDDGGGEAGVLHRVESADGHAAGRGHAVDLRLGMRAARVQQRRGALDGLQRRFDGFLRIQAQLHAALCGSAGIAERESDPEKMQDDAKELFVEPDFEIHVQAEAPEESHAEDDILQFIPPKAAPSQPVAHPKTEVKPEPKPQQPVEQPKPVEAPKPATTPKQPVPEQPKPQQPKPQRSLNDLFNEKREDHSISSQYQHAKVGDLTKAISINDKFIYIKELFHNRGEDFSASIHQLNECRNLEEAFDCLEQLKQKFFWDTKTDAYLSFCDLLRRKYS